MDEQEWLEYLFSDEPPGGELAPGWARWLHEFYLARGPEPSEVVDEAAVETQRQLAEVAIERLAPDVAATLATRVSMAVVYAYNAVRVTVDGQIAGTMGVAALELEAVVVGVADGVQEEIMDDWRVWPVCTTHGFGLHPELDEDQAVWMCHQGPHQVAPIGSLS